MDVIVMAIKYQIQMYVVSLLVDMALKKRSHCSLSFLNFIFLMTENKRTIANATTLHIMIEAAKTASRINNDINDFPF